MSLFVDMNQEETYRSLMDYFTGKRMKIAESSQPSFIHAEIGSWTSTVLGKVEASISKRNGGCYVNLTFNFHKTYLALILSVAVSFIILLVLATVWKWSIEEVIGVGGFIISAVSILGIIVFSRSVSSTKSRLVEELGSFLRSISESMKR